MSDKSCGAASATQNKRPASDGIQPAEIEQRLEVLFRKAGDDPLMARLRQAILQHHLRPLQ